MSFQGFPPNVSGCFSDCLGDVLDVDLFSLFILGEPMKGVLNL
jgi:hypothetical protein